MARSALLNSKGIVIGDVYGSPATAERNDKGHIVSVCRLVGK